jgi:hypothetical protein
MTREPLRLVSCDAARVVHIRGARLPAEDTWLVKRELRAYCEWKGLSPAHFGL